MSCEILLKHMQGATSHAPISVDDLVEKTGLLPDTIIALLDQMHNQVPAPINKAKITSAGKTSIVCWPTGQIQKFSYTQTNTALHKPRIPREPIKAKETAVNNRNKFSEIDIVKHVINNPNSTMIDIKNHFCGDDPIARQKMSSLLTHIVGKKYLQIKAVRIGDKAVKILELGANEQWLAQHDLLPALKNLNAFEQVESAKPTFQTIDIDKDKAATEVAINNGTQSPFPINTALLNAVDGANRDLENIPAFLRKPADTKTPAEPSKPINHGQGVLFDGIMSLCSTLPDYSSITIKVDKQGDHEVQLTLDDGDQLFRFNDDIIAVQKVIDAYNVLQQFKDAS